MRAPGFRTLLLAVTLTLAGATVAAVAAVTYWQLRRLVEREALGRSQRAAGAVADAVRAIEESTARAASLLADWPVLGTVPVQPNAPGALSVAGEADTASIGRLERFCTSSDLDACGVWFGGQRLVAGPPELLAWTTEAPGGEFRSLRSDGTLLVGSLVANARAGREAPSAAAVAVALDPAWLQAWQDTTGESLRWLAPAEILARYSEPQASLWREALAGRAAARVFGRGLGAVAVVPVLAPTGDVIAIVEAQRSQQQIVAPLRQFLVRTLVATVVIGLGAILAAVVLARRLAAPIAGLTAAAQSLGRGDIASPFPILAGGEIGALGAAMEDMRRRLVTASSELDRRGNELEGILSGIAEGVFAVDRERRIRYLNPQAAALLGVHPAAVIGTFCGDVLRPALVDGVRPCEEACPILHSRARGAARATERLELPAGTRSVVLSSAPPVGGMQVQIVREESPLEAARRGRDEVVADFAHELKTPLAAQAASLELLRERLAQDEDAPSDRRQLADLVAAAEGGTLRLRRLIDNLLESVRIESGQTGIRRLPVAIDEVVEEAVEMTRPLLARRHQVLEVHLAYPLPEVIGDPPRLSQVLVNLLSNASKFAAEGSTVRLVATVVSPGVELAVEDEGPGFAPGSFESGPRRFERGSQSEPREEGIGLGLWIARSIVERHGGHLSIARIDGRTRIALVLPAQEPA